MTIVVLFSRIVLMLSFFHCLCNLVFLLAFQFFKYWNPAFQFVGDLHRESWYTHRSIKTRQQQKAQKGGFFLSWLAFLLSSWLWMRTAVLSFSSWMLEHTVRALRESAILRGGTFVRITFKNALRYWSCSNCDGHECEEGLIYLILFSLKCAASLVLNSSLLRHMGAVEAHCNHFSPTVAPTSFLQPLSLLLWMKVGLKWMHFVCIWNKASFSFPHRRSVSLTGDAEGGCCGGGRLQGFSCGSFMWPFVRFMCSWLCIDGSVPVIDGTLLLWCRRFNGAWQSKRKQHATREGT